MTPTRPTRLLRLFDLALVVVAAPVWAPTLVAGALAVVAESGRPVLFRQARIGRHGVPFTMLKLRSMRTGENPLVPDASRITRVGAALRRTSLDELPQVLNVLRGDMSLVGPRPILPQQLDVMTADQKRRHRVRPGLTGPSQVSGRNAIGWAQQFDLDRAWADAPTVRGYLTILARSGRVIVAGSGIEGHDPDDPLLVDLATPTGARAGLPEPDSRGREVDIDLAAKPAATAR